MSDADLSSPPLKVHYKESDAFECIDRHVAVRSALLSGVLETEGKVFLPDTMTMPQFIVWRDAPAPWSAETEELSKLCTILTVCFSSVLTAPFRCIWSEASRSRMRSTFEKNELRCWLMGGDECRNQRIRATSMS